MPYIPLELDAKKMVPKIARAVGSPVGDIGWGLWELWEWCYTEQRNVITELMLFGLFGRSEGISQALCDFGFLERLKDGTFRVRGAERLINASTSQARGGQSRAQNAKRDDKGRMLKAPSSHPADASSESSSAGPAAQLSWSSESSASPALTPNTKHQTPNEEEASFVCRTAVPENTIPDFKLQKLSREQEDVTEPHYVPEPGGLGERIEAEFREARGANYEWDWPSQQALRSLMRHPEADVLTRWRRALKRSGFPKVSTIAELARNWNHFAADEPKETPKEGKGRWRAQDSDWSNVKVGPNGELLK